MKPAGIILAGGASSRMGSPKALLPVPGSNETFLDRLIRVLGSVCAPVIVVLGHDAERIGAGAARASEAVLVTNQEYRQGQLSSLQCGLRALPQDAAGFLFTPVDIPTVTSETVAELAAAFAREAGRVPVAIPRYQGRGGHPVACARELAPEFLALGGDAQARDVIHRYVARTCYVDVDDPGILRDIDDVETYRALLAPFESK